MLREFRESSNAKTTQGYAKVPHLFAQLTQPDAAPYIIIPSAISERRRYIPIGFMSPNDILVRCSNYSNVLPLRFWYPNFKRTYGLMHGCAGRLKSDYRCSAKIVYNNFPGRIITESQKKRFLKQLKLFLMHVHCILIAR